MRFVDAQGRLFGTVSLIDLTVGSLLLCLSPLVYYGYGSLTGHFALSIEDVRPTTVTAGANQRLTIMGNGFDAQSTIQLAGLPPQQARFINDARLDLEKIPSEIEPGWQHVRVMNGRGRFVVRNQGVYVSWQPEITSVSPETVPAGRQSSITVTGRYFETDCAVTIGSLPADYVTYGNPTELQVFIFPTHAMIGKVDLHIVNPDGHREGVLRNGLTVMPFNNEARPRRESMAVTPPPAVAPKSPAAPQPSAAPGRTRPAHNWPTCVPAHFMVAFAFPDLSEEDARSLRRGATEFVPGGPLQSKIVEVHRISWRPNNSGPAARYLPSRQTVVAWIWLTGDVEPHDHPPTYFYRGEPLYTTGIQIPFRFGGRDVVGFTLSDPHPETLKP